MLIRALPITFGFVVVKVEHFVTNFPIMPSQLVQAHHSEAQGCDKGYVALAASKSWYMWWDIRCIVQMAIESTSRMSARR